MRLSGTPDASVNRAKLLAALSLPAKLSPNGLLDALNCLYERQEFLSVAQQILDDHGTQSADE